MEKKSKDLKLKNVSNLKASGYAAYKTEEAERAEEALKTLSKFRDFNKLVIALEKLYTEQNVLFESQAELIIQMYA